MYKSMKKVTVFLVFIMIFSSMGVYASEENNTIESTQISEYEVYMELLSKTDEELLKSGLTKEEIEEIRNFDLEKELKYRASLSDEDLKFLGYNDREIIELRNYVKEGSITPLHNGGSDSGGIFATLTLRTELISHTSSRVMVQFRWQWNKAPVYFGGKEIVGFAWNGTDTAGRPLNVKINTSSSTHSVYVKANKIPSKWYYPGYKVDDIYHSAKSEFAYGWRIDDSMAWSEKGSGIIYIDRTGTASIKQIGLNIAYGHTTIGIGGSIDFTPPFLNISFSPTMERMANVSDTYGKK